MHVLVPVIIILAAAHSQWQNTEVARSAHLMRGHGSINLKRGVLRTALKTILWLRMHEQELHVKGVCLAIAAMSVLYTYMLG